jgi:superkiller protein 8
VGAEPGLVGYGGVSAEGVGFGLGYVLTGCRSQDGKAKIWRIETRSCVATHSHGDKALWSAKWLPKSTRSEMFALAGGTGAISFYREAAG